jgi:hypothetical protein
MNHKRTFIRTGCFALILLLAGCDTGFPDLSEELQAIADQLDEALSPLAQLAKPAGDQFEQYAAQGVADPVAALINWLKTQPGVVDAYRSPDGISVIVELENGETLSIITDGKDRAEWVTTGGTSKFISPAEPPVEVVESPYCRLDGSAKTKNNNAAESIDCDPKSFPSKKKALLIAAYQQQFKQDISRIAAPLQRAGYDTSVVSLKTVSDVTAFRNALSESGVIYISTHGLVGELNDGTTGNVITTEIPVDPNDVQARRKVFAQLTEALGENVGRFVRIVGTTHGPVIGLSPEFFASANYPNTFVYVDACHSDRTVGTGGTQLRDVFLSRGAGAYVGWDSSISSDIALKATEGIFNALAPAPVTIDSVTITTSPSDPGAGQSYVPSVTISPPAAGIEVRLSISGTDGYSNSQKKTTGANGRVDFSSIPGGAANVQDTITAVAGGGDNADTVLSVVIRNKPDVVNLTSTLRWAFDALSLANLNFYLGQSANASFNLVCNNNKLVTTKTIIKF